MKNRIRLLAVLLVWSVGVLAACGRTDEPIPLTTVSQSTDDEEPEDNLPETSDGEELPEYDVDLPEDLSSFTLAIWGDTYPLPLSYEEFLAAGWTPEDADAEDRQVTAESYLEGVAFSREGNGLLAYMLNPDPREKALSDCLVGGLHIDTSLPEAQNIHVNLPGGIVLQQSRLDEVEAAYGAPKDRYEEDGMIQLTYEYGLYQTVTLGFDETEECLFLLDIQNLNAMEQGEEPMDVSDAVPPEVEAYAEPEEEGRRFSECVVTYDGVLYRVPVPVRVMTEHGWTINEKESDAAVRGGKYGYATLEKDGQKLYSVIANPSAEAVPAKNGFVTSLYGDIVTTKVPIVLAGGVTLGMGEEEFLLLTEDETAEKTEDPEQGVVRYTFYQSEDGQDYTEVTVDARLHIITEIHVVKNEPEALTDVPEANEDEEAGQDSPPAMPAKGTDEVPEEEGTDPGAEPVGEDVSPSPDPGQGSEGDAGTKAAPEAGQEE